MQTEIHNFFNTKTRRHEDFFQFLYLKVINILYSQNFLKHEKWQKSLCLRVFQSLCLKKARICLILMCILTTPGFATIVPWGKDADIVMIKSRTETPAPEHCKTPLLGAIGEAVITFHQTQITQCDGPRSNFRPSSSQYMLDAMRKYGFFQGFSMGCDRLMRENGDPWVYRSTLNEHQEVMKWDPVP